MQTSPASLLRGTALALAIGLFGQQNAQTATLRDAATLNPAKASEIRFDQVYRITPHNTYNPNDWPSLTAALDEGVRTIELDVYNTIGFFAGNPELCAAYGGTWRSTHQPPFCDSITNPTALRDALREAVVQAFEGRPVAAHPLFSLVGLQVKHDPVGEDPIVYDLLLQAAIVFPTQSYIPIIGVAAARREFYGNNCSRGDVTTVGNMKTELARCLQTIRAWMDAHPGHTPITLLFDIKQNMHLDAALAFDVTLRAVFGNNLYTPKELQEGYASPRARVIDKGWPKLSELNGKVLAIYARGETFQVKGHTEPNDTLRYYLNGIADAYLDPAAFVCPLVNSGPDVAAPYSFGRGKRIGPADYPRLMGEVVCSNIYTGQETEWTLDTAAVPMQDALAAVSEARKLNLLTYVWSFHDPLAAYPEVAHEFVRRGVNMFSIERGGLKAPVPHPYTDHVLPWEGLAGITNYGFILRQRNNPYFVMTAQVDGRITLSSYTGAASQQWALSRTGRLYSLADTSKCVTLLGPHREHAFGRPESLDNEDDNWTHEVQVSQHPAAEMRPCGASADAFQSFTLMQGEGVTGLLLLLNPNKLHNSGWLPQFLTPTAYNESAGIVVDTRNQESIYCVNSNSTQRRAWGADFPTSGSPFGFGYFADGSSCIHRQAFEVDFHTSAAAVVDGALGTAPQKDWIVVPDEGPGSHTPPLTWRNFAFVDPNYDAIRNAPISTVQINLWTFGWLTNYFYPGAIANNTLPFTAIPRGTGGPVVDFALAASEFLSPTEYAKWQSAARTLVSDVPADPALNQLARDLLWDGALLETCSSSPSSKYCVWKNLPKTPHPQPYQYWEIPNKPYLWYLAGKMLPPAEHAKWQQRLKYRAIDLYVDPETNYVTVQLMENGVNWTEPYYSDALGSLYNNELREFWNRQSPCLAYGDEPGPPPSELCPHAVSPASDHRYRWNLIPFDADHRVMAEAAFNSPKPALASTRQPEDWALWSAAAAIKEAAANNRVTWRDVPLGATYHTIVTGSKLLDDVEKGKYLEKERLENDFVSQQRTITHLDVDPDELKREVAAQYLSAKELALWQERTAVALKDVPLNSTLLANGKAAKLLSARELADFTSQVQAEGHVDGPLPRVWPDVPPARGRRFAAQYLLPASEYPKWVEAEAGTELDFPAVWTNKVVENIAAKTLSLDEFSAWKKIIGANPPQVTNHKWLMMPHRPSAHWISVRMLANVEATKWVEMINQTMLPQHLGGSLGAINYAKSALSAADFETWQAYASQLNMPLTWQAFRHDKSLMQKRIVEAIFGANSPDYNAWVQDAGLQ